MDPKKRKRMQAMIERAAKDHIEKLTSKFNEVFLKKKQNENNKK